MISAVFIVLAFILSASQPTPAQAQSFAECQAWLCLPAGYDTRGGEPTNACEPARQAVLSRLRRYLDPLPSWSSCASQFDWDAANLRWSQTTDDPCPHGGSLSAGLCRGIDADGCSFTYTPRESGHVWVYVDGQRMDARYDARSMPYTLANAGTPNVDRDTCPDDCVDCPLGDGNGNGNTCPPGWFWSEGVGKCIDPLVVGPPVPCNTIACPHVQHTWGADPLNIHWTLRAEGSRR